MAVGCGERQPWRIKLADIGISLPGMVKCQCARCGRRKPSPSGARASPMNSSASSPIIGQPLYGEAAKRRKIVPIQPA